MKNVALQIPTLAFVVVTRAALAGGLGLLLSDRIPTRRRRTVGKMLVALGVLTTIPAAISIVRGVKASRRGTHTQPGDAHCEPQAGDL